MRDARLELRLPHKQKEVWELAARERGVSLSQLVVQGVEALLAAQSASATSVSERVVSAR